MFDNGVHRRRKLSFLIPLSVVPLNSTGVRWLFVELYKRNCMQAFWTRCKTGTENCIRIILFINFHNIRDSHIFSLLSSFTEQMTYRIEIVYRKLSKFFLCRKRQDLEIVSTWVTNRNSLFIFTPKVLVWLTNTTDDQRLLIRGSCKRVFATCFFEPRIIYLDLVGFRTYALWLDYRAKLSRSELILQRDSLKSCGLVRI